MSDSDAIEEFEARLKKAQQKSDKREEADIVFSMGVEYSTNLRDFPKAIEKYKKAMEIAFAQQYWYRYYEAALDLGAVYERGLRQPQNALHVFEKTISEGGVVHTDSEGLEHRETIERVMAMLKESL